MQRGSVLCEAFLVEHSTEALGRGVAVARHLAKLNHNYFTKHIDEMLSKDKLNRYQSPVMVVISAGVPITALPRHSSLLY